MIATVFRQSYMTQHPSLFTPQTYRKLPSDVIRGGIGNCCSVYKLHDRTTVNMD